MKEQPNPNNERAVPRPDDKTKEREGCDVLTERELALLLQLYLARPPSHIQKAAKAFLETGSKSRLDALLKACIDDQRRHWRENVEEHGRYRAMESIGYAHAKIEQELAHKKLPY